MGMPRLFQSLSLLDGRSGPGPASWNMALDEALLMSGGGVVLRFYRWERPVLSFGYFVPWRDAREAAGGREIMRRWTGGGMVLHGGDVTWSLVVPAGEPVAGLRPAASYAAIHGALADALRAAGVEAEQVPADHPAPAGGLCFTAPAPGDLLLHGRKIAGAGQRRSRHGLLHQGSLCGVPVPDHFPGLLAEALAVRVTVWPAAQIPERAAQAQALVESRYGRRSWLEKC